MKSTIETPTKSIIESTPITPYKASLNINGSISSATGDTMQEAMAKLKPIYYKTKGVLSVSYGKLKTERLLNICQMKRLFYSELSRDVMAKQLKLILK